MKSLGTQAENPPLEFINGWYVIRYGYEPISGIEGVFTFVEHRFKSKPTIERIQALVENYNVETGSNIVINVEDLTGELREDKPECYEEIDVPKEEDSQEEEIDSIHRK